MGSYKNIKKYALVSVYDKKELSIICKHFYKFNIGIISTGSTFNKIKMLGYECLEISKLTKSKEILNGRVKTLHPKIFTSILYNRNKSEDVETFKKTKFLNIEFVVVNFYPFQKSLNQKFDNDKIIEMIDIGGPTLVRAAAKNYISITSICSTKDYLSFCQNLTKNFGTTDLNFRKKMASKVFKMTNEYDRSIFNWLSKKSSDYVQLKYGENPYQESKLIKSNNKTFLDYQIQGKQISYNNILDINSGLDYINEFKEPTTVIIKHNNACGVASSKKIEESYKKAFDSDSKSAFGGVIILNRRVSSKVSELILNKYYEIIVAPGFSRSSIENFKKKKKLILIDSKKIHKNEKINSRSIRNGHLIQKANNYKITKKNFINVSNNKKITKNELEDIVFAFKIVKHTKSNAIVLVKNKQTIGIGAGQMNRFDATRIALMKYKDNFNIKNYVCASDAFFPFIDSLKILIKNNCKCVAQPYGSINDSKIIAYANKRNIKLLFSKKRVFKH